MDPVCLERERVPGPEAAHAAATGDLQVLPGHLAGDHEDAAARAAVVVKAAVAGLPPGVEPRLGAVGAPERTASPSPERSSASTSISAAARVATARHAPGRARRRRRPRPDRCWARRHPLSSLGEDAAMGVVARIEAWPVNVPLEAAYLMAPGVYPGMSRTVVRVTTGDGVVGLGETPSPDRRRAPRRRARRRRSSVARPTRSGRSWADGAGPSVARVDAAVVTPNAAAGVEIALWDIAAREAEFHCASSSARSCARRSRSPSTSPRGPAARKRRPRSRTTAPGWSTSTARRHSRARPRSSRLSATSRRCASSARRSARTACCGSTRTWAGALDTATRMLAALEPYDIANVEEPTATFTELRGAAESLPHSVLVAYARSRSRTRARRPGRDRRRRRRLRRHRRHAPLRRALRRARRRLLVLQRRSRHRDGGAAACDGGRAAARPPQPEPAPLDDRRRDRTGRPPPGGRCVAARRKGRASASRSTSERSRAASSAMRATARTSSTPARAAAVVGRGVR